MQGRKKKQRMNENGRKRNKKERTDLKSELCQRQIRIVDSAAIEIQRFCFLLVGNFSDVIKEAFTVLSFLFACTPSNVISVFSFYWVDNGSTDPVRFVTETIYRQT